MRYLLVYQHSVHHPREDRLFARIREREPRLYRNMQRLVREHRVGQERAESMARELARTTPAQLRGKAGVRLSRQLQDYVRHTREHMRREETVFYTGSARVLRASDWAALMSGPMPRDPAGDLHRLAARYPRLAARLAQPEREVTGPGERRPHRRTVAGSASARNTSRNSAARRCTTRPTSPAVARRPSEGALAVGLARASFDTGRAQLRYAAKLASLPFRR